jgi:hypothetical protein
MMIAFPVSVYSGPHGGLMGTIVLLDLMGGVALLLWGLHFFMIKGKRDAPDVHLRIML